jgi:hypothetical protein
MFSAYFLEVRLSQCSPLIYNLYVWTSNNRLISEENRECEKFMGHEGQIISQAFLWELD